MFLRVDGSDTKAKLEGFSYLNAQGKEEAVLLEGTTVYVMYVENKAPLSIVYVGDIPKLIKALQAAYDYEKGQE